MGSGHFLVNTVDHLTDGIIRRMQVYHDTHPDVPWDWNPVQRLIERMRGEIGAEMARQGITIDPARLDDTSLLTRLVMKRCIYGVDLNPLAVELAKLSLWLHTFTVGAPLSFLDHHLRWGNSVIGADVRTVERAMRGEVRESKATAESRRLAEARAKHPRSPRGHAVRAFPGSVRRPARPDRGDDRGGRTLRHHPGRRAGERRGLRRVPAPASSL